MINMKRRVFWLLVALVALQIISTTAYGQGIDLGARIPADTAAIVGRLPNGMTYYIRRNAKPAGQAEFFLARHVGAIDESDAQQGLAHFLEHMSFDGTKNFPGNRIIDYLETIGVKFGANLNAATGVESTVFNISRVPLLREGIVDSVLLILHDWSSQLTLDSAAIDKERGVIVEELRTRNSASRRLWEKSAPILYDSSKYSYRNLIGYEDYLKTFPHGELTDFYHTWYRTDNQAVIVVGDFDPKVMQQKVARTLSDIPASRMPTPREVIPIRANVEPLVFVGSDPEQQTSDISIFIKRPPIPRDERDLVKTERTNIMDQLITSMVNYRLTEIVQKPDAPFVSAGSGSGSLTETSDVFLMRCTAREGEIDKALRALYTELERIIRHGFTQGELDIVRSDFISDQRQAYQNRADRFNSQFVDRYIDNFFDGSPIPDASYEWKLDSALVYPMTLDEVNALARQNITRENQVIIIYSPQKAGLLIPTESDVREAIEAVRASDIAPYKESVVAKELTGKLPKSSKVVKEQTDTRMGATAWTLGNGIRVVWKRTDFMADQIVMKANSYGGLSLVPNNELVSGCLLTSVVGNSGVGQFDATELMKQLAGKNVSLDPDVSNFENGFSGSCAVADLETMFQLLYLSFTEPRFTREDFGVTIDKMATRLQNARTNPNFIMQDSLVRTLYNNNPRRNIIDLDRLGQARFEQMAPIYKTLYGNPGDFTYIFVGSVDPAVLKPLVEKYLGALPARKTSLTWRDDKARPVKGEVSSTFSVKMEQPKSSVAHIYTGGGVDYTLENLVTMSALKQVLDMRCIETIRQDKSGTYGVAVSGILTQVPTPRYTLALSFDTNAAMADELAEMLHQQVLTLASAGVTAEELSKIKEYMLKQRRDDLKRNGPWLGYLDNWYTNHIDMVAGYEDLVSGLTSDKIKAMAAKIVADGNICRIRMNPKTE